MQMLTDLCAARNAKIEVKPFGHDSTQIQWLLTIMKSKGNWQSPRPWRSLANMLGLARR